MKGGLAFLLEERRVENENLGRRINVKKAFVLMIVIMVLLAVCKDVFANSWITLDYPGAIRSKPKAIDGSNIVGHYYDGDEHGFLYDGTNWTAIGYPGSVYGRAYGIDGSNIVGYYYDGSAWRGFLYAPTAPSL